MPAQSCRHSNQGTSLSGSRHFRICPNCPGKFTLDRDAKYRQGIVIVIAVISLREARLDSDFQIYDQN